MRWQSESRDGWVKKFTLWPLKCDDGTVFWLEWVWFKEFAAVSVDGMSWTNAIRPIEKPPVSLNNSSLTDREKV